MKSKLIIASLLLSVAFYSCKDDKKSEAVKAEEKPKTFDIALNMTVKQNDRFQLFYTDEATPGFEEKKSVWVDVKGSEKPQDIIFNLPEDEIPTNLRLDLGVNNKQPEMKFNSFSLSYFDKNFTLKDSSILQFFVPGQIEFNKETSTIKTNQGSAVAYDPMLYPQDNLKAEIQKLVK